MEFRVQLLGGSANIVQGLAVNARNPAGAIEMLTGIDWPPRAITMRIIDSNGTTIHETAEWSFPDASHTAKRNGRL